MRQWHREQWVRMHWNLWQKIGAPVPAVQSAVGPNVIELSNGGRGETALFAQNTVISGCGGLVYSISRGLDDDPESAWSAIFAISAVADPPNSQRITMPADRFHRRRTSIHLARDA